MTSLSKDGEALTTAPEGDAAPLYREIAQMWTELLNPIEPLGPGSNFFEVGGDSMAVMVMLFQVEERFGVAIPQLQLTNNPTLDAFSALVFTSRVKMQDGAPSAQPTIEGYL